MDKQAKLSKELRDDGCYLESRAVDIAENEGMSIAHITSTRAATPVDINTLCAAPHDDHLVSARFKNGLKKDYSDTVMNDDTETSYHRRLGQNLPPKTMSDEYCRQQKGSNVQKKHCSAAPKGQSSLKVQAKGSCIDVASVIKCDRCLKTFKSERLLHSHEVLIHKIPSQYYCHTCNKYLPFASSLKSHILFHEGLRYFEFEQCGKRFQSNAHLKRHWSIHTGDRPFQCKLWGKAFKQNSGLKKHLRLSIHCKFKGTQESYYNKNVKSNERHKNSSKRFRSNVHLKEQVRLTSSNIECSKCQKLFRNQTTLYGHQVLIHKMPSKYYCQTCKKYLPFAHNLRSHVLFHQGIKYFECEYCKRRLRSKGHLQEHLRIHTGERPFGCGLCGKKFTRNSDLKTHIKKCSNCESRIEQLSVQVARVNLNQRIANDDLIFTTTSNHKDSEMSSTESTATCNPMPVDLSTHTSPNGDDQQPSTTTLEHATEKVTVERDRLSTPHSLKLCEESSLRSMLNKCIRPQKSSILERTSAKGQPISKLRAVLEGPLTSNAIACDKCQQMFKTERLLLRHKVLLHKKRTKYYCHICKKYLLTAHALKSHILFHEGIKFFECEHCKRRFLSNTHLQDHLRIHTGDKPFGCELCGSKFRQNSALRVQLRIHTKEKPHQCSVCGKGFRQSSNFRSHMKMHHL